MTLRSRERPTLMLSVLLAASVLAVFVFGGLAIGLRDWVAGLFAVIALIGSVRLAKLRLRFARHAAIVPPPPAPSAPAASSRPGRAFVATASHCIGARHRRGHVVIGRDVAAFVPTGEWQHLAAELAVGLFVQRMPLSHVDLDADDTPALAGELAEMVGRRDGFLIDANWSWTQKGRALARTASQESLTIDRRSPDAIVARWPVLPAPPAAEQRRMYVRILAIGGAVTGLFAGAGVLAWQLTDDADYLVAGLSYAALIGGSVVAGVIVARKRLRARG